MSHGFHPVAVLLAVSLLPGLAAPVLAQAEDDLPQRAMQILEERCYRCHGASGGEGLNVLDSKSLLAPPEDPDFDTSYVTPGDLEASKLWQYVAEDLMPKGKEKLSVDEKAVLRLWIMEGEGKFPVADKIERPLVTELEIYRAIRNHMSSRPEEERSSLRFFSIAHLHNDLRVLDRDLRLYRAALSKAVNSLSRVGRITRPEAVDEHQTVFVIDLKDYGWTGEDIWTRVVEDYPYGLKPSGSEELQIYNDLSADNFLGAGIGFDGFVYLRADWFVAKASRPPLYHTLLGIPQTLGELLTELGVDREGDFQQNRLMRTGVVKSGVSAENRLVDLHFGTRRAGLVSISYDFNQSSGKGNITRFPLGPTFENHPFPGQVFEHAGGEIIFRLANGLHGYMLVDEKGGRIDKGPTNIVFDPDQTSGTPEIVNGLSCMHCHREGMLLMQGSLKNRLAVFDDARSKADRLFRTDEEINAELNRERAHYLRASEDAMGEFLRTDKMVDDNGSPLPIADVLTRYYGEPVSKVATLYDREIGISTAAVELGAGDNAERLQIKLDSTEFRLLGLGPLIDGGTIKRSMWDALEPLGSPFQRTAAKLNLGTFQIRPRAVSSSE